ncbi:proline-rich protein 1 [Pyrus ussuriensis x Pyrus communis]|uniref:Proline-rich protein 1 n=1 Tax=Pyrus ussuriensis x Pyrus communis TaxID=2448454 RepID=A0A5N5F504_9ROSA|nr:proline-rich protein 1 [Pyrus ussuriensis x Pyrus communis]
MARRSFIIFISSLLLISLSFPSATASDYSPETPEQTEKVVVEGVVYCQSCDRYGTSSLAGAEPIPSAKISVICKNHKGQVSFYKSFVADVKGYFYAQLEGFKVGQHLLDHPLHGCKVKLVSSPLAKCSELTNVNYGLYGAPLRYEDKRLWGRNYEAVVYAAGPLAFRPSYCPTTHS